jgi:hypothetical protein
MLNTILKYTGLFILLIAIQILLMNNIQFSGFINPYIYILFILVMDLTSGTLGLHIAATVFAGFLRPYVLNLISPHEGYEKGELPGLQTYGFRWFITYILIIVTFHHIALFYIEVFRFEYFFRTLLRVMLSTGFTVLFIIIIQAIIIRR